MTRVHESFSRAVRGCVLAVVFLLAMAVAAMAQARIVVADEAGGRVAGAAISLASAQGATLVEGATDGSGSFALPALPR